MQEALQAAEAISSATFPVIVVLCIAVFGLAAALYSERRENRRRTDAFVELVRGYERLCALLLERRGP